ncbi:cyclic lactone autoinducer peptide [Thermacetogenium phaeum]|nr:cyclic lactone autoinducer peptide [Thermacetogenium phaeum]
MFRTVKTNLLRFASVLLLVVAATGVSATCWFHWYQPKLPEKG